MMDKKKPWLYLCKLWLLLLFLVSQGTLASRYKFAGIGGFVDQVGTQEKLMEKEEFVKGRMDIESNDYSGSGANNRHDPGFPGKI